MFEVEELKARKRVINKEWENYAPQNDSLQSIEEMKAGFKEAVWH